MKRKKRRRKIRLLEQRLANAEKDIAGLEQLIGEMEIERARYRLRLTQQREDALMVLACQAKARGLQQAMEKLFQLEERRKKKMAEIDRAEQRLQKDCGGLEADGPA